jgi:hypothetical protein
MTVLLGPIEETARLAADKISSCVEGAWQRMPAVTVLNGRIGVVDGNILISNDRENK